MKKLFSLLLLVLCLLTSCSESESPLSPDDNSNEESFDVKEEIDRINKEVGDIFLGCTSPADFMSALKKHGNLKGVKNIEQEDDVVGMELECGEKIAWFFPPQDSLEETENLKKQIKSFTNGLSRAQMNGKGKKICFINQYANDEARSSCKKKISDLVKKLEDLKYQVDIINGSDFNRNFVSEKMVNYDAIFIYTHGALMKDASSKSNTHWILLGESYLDNLEKQGGRSKGIPGIMCGVITEKINGKDSLMKYIAIDENQLNRMIKGEFADNSIMFNTACQSLKDNNKLAIILMSKNLGGYVGFDESNTIGRNASGYMLMYGLTEGFSLQEIYNNMPEELKSEDGMRPLFERYTAHLQMYSIKDNIYFNNQDTIETEEWVDLGLSVKWRSRNLDAKYITDMGKTYSCWETAWWNQEKLEKLPGGGTTICGSIYDPAKQANCGRMPSEKELEELLYKCKWQVLTINRKVYFKVIGSNGNFIIIPAEVKNTYQKPFGYGFYAEYWTGDCNARNTISFNVKGIISLDEKTSYAQSVWNNTFDMWNGNYHIRPVL